MIENRIQGLCFRVIQYINGKESSWMYKKKIKQYSMYLVGSDTIYTIVATADSYYKNRSISHLKRGIFPVKEIQAEYDNGKSISFDLIDFGNYTRQAAAEIADVLWGDYQRNGYNLVGRMPSRTHSNYKLRQADADAMRKAYGDGYSISDLCKMYDVSASNVHSILHNDTFFDPKYRVQMRPNYGRAKLTGRKVSEIRRLRAKEHLTMKELSIRFGVSIRAISDILNGKTYTTFSLPDNIKLED